MYEYYLTDSLYSNFKSISVNRGVVYLQKFSMEFTNNNFLLWSSKRLNVFIFLW